MDSILTGLLLTAINEIVYQALDKNGKAYAVALDISKVFDLLSLA